jgi:hypothetical protein
MSKRLTSITATYRLSDDGELLQFTVRVPDPYPDAISEAKATVLSLLRDGLADVLRQTRADDAPLPD